MVRIVIENISDDALKKYYSEYMSQNDREDSDSCEVCKLPNLLHIDSRGEIIIGPCDKYTASEYSEIWTIFRQKIRPIRRWYENIQEEKEEKKNNFLQGFTTLTEAIMDKNNGTIELQNIIDVQDYLEENDDIELDPTVRLKIMGIVQLIISNFNETRSKEVGENEKEQETNNKCLECNKEFGSIEELRVHEQNCYICEQCNNWYESRKDLEDHKEDIKNLYVTNVVIIGMKVKKNQRII